MEGLKGISPQGELKYIEEEDFKKETFKKDFPYASTFIDFQNALIDYSIQCRLPKTTEENRNLELAAQIKVTKMYNHLLTLLQENNISPNDYYG